MHHQDDLERFIGDHRDEFEQGEPDGRVWNRLENALFMGASTEKKPLLIRRISGVGKRWLSAAAVLLLCLSLAAFIRTYQVRVQAMDTAIPEDLQEAQAYYENGIAQRLERIKVMAYRQNSGSDTAMWQLFGRRDAEYERLRKAVQENPGNEHVRAAFVEYYRSRLEVLKQVEKRMDDLAGK